MVRIEQLLSQMIINMNNKANNCSSFGFFFSYFLNKLEEHLVHNFTFKAHIIHSSFIIQTFANIKSKLTFQRNLPLGLHTSIRVVNDPPVLLPSPPDPVQSDPLLQHAHSQTLLESTRLTCFAATFVDFAVVWGGTGVFDIAWKDLKNGLLSY